MIQLLFLLNRKYLNYSRTTFLQMNEVKSRFMINIITLNNVVAAHPNCALSLISKAQSTVDKDVLTPSVS